MTHQDADRYRSELYQLEVSLWVAETRYDRRYMDQVLAPTFFEFGRSGRTYSRQETLAIEGSGPIRIQLPLKHFRVTPIGDDVYLVTYVSEVWYDDLQVGNRSSLWRRTPDGWKLHFHQGTPA